MARETGNKRKFIDHNNDPDSAAEAQGEYYRHRRAMRNIAILLILVGGMGLLILLGLISFEIN